MLKNVVTSQKLDSTHSVLILTSGKDGTMTAVMLKAHIIDLDI